MSVQYGGEFGGVPPRPIGERGLDERDELRATASTSTSWWVTTATGLIVRHTQVSSTVTGFSPANSKVSVRGCGARSTS